MRKHRISNQGISDHVNVEYYIADEADAEITKLKADVDELEAVVELANEHVADQSLDSFQELEAGLIRLEKSPSD